VPLGDAVPAPVRVPSVPVPVEGGAAELPAGAPADPPALAVGGVAVVAPGAVAAGVVGADTVGIGSERALAAGLLEPESPASFTNAAASTARASTVTSAISITGARQFGDAASRVRAAAPQRGHQSWAGFSGAPHSGHASGAGVPGAGSGPIELAGPVEGGAAALTARSGRWGA
jgi:hypothetical protein